MMATEKAKKGNSGDDNTAAKGERSFLQRRFKGPLTLGT